MTWGGAPGGAIGALESAPDGFAALDAEGRILHLNACATKLAGVALDQAVGRDFAELLLAERDRHRVWDALHAVSAGLAGRAPRALDVTLTGEQPAELAISAVPSDGEPGFHVWIHDVSERTQLLREMAGHLRGAGPGFAEILDSLAEAVTIRDPDHHIIYANRAAVEHMGFSSLEELQSRPPHSIIGDYIVTDEQGRELTMEAIPSVKLLAGQEAEPLLMRTIHRQTGALAWQRLKASPLIGEDARPVAAVTIIEDVTTEKIAELRERFLARASETLMSSIDYEETLRNVAWLAVPEIADWCAVDLCDPAGGFQRVAVAHPDPAKISLAERLQAYEPADPEGSAPERVVRTGASELWSEITDEMIEQGARDEEHLSLLRAVGFRSALIVPMILRGRPLGVLTLVTSESLRRLDESDREFAEQLAGRAAIAVDNARLATSRREIALTLQRSLLPHAVPEIEGWEVATLYRAASASDEVEVGGDFYDFMQTPEGWIVLLGDVTGRGVQAAAMTSLVRHGARFLARGEPSPSAILTRLDEALREQPGLSLCTALCLRLQTDGVLMSSAGHPAPLIVHADGAVREIGQSGPLLGGFSEAAWEDVPVPVASGDTLLMYTDGVTDTRGQEERFGTARLRRVMAAQAGASPAELLRALEAALDEFQVAGISDDTGAVALRLASVPAPSPAPRGRGRAAHAS